MKEEAGDPHLALKLGDASRIEHFDPAFFAAMCSPDMNVAAGRLAEYKRLVNPFTLDMCIGTTETRIAFHCLASEGVPPTMALTEIVFFVNFARRATRFRIVPSAVSMPFALPDPAAFEAHFGCPVSLGESAFASFAADDARRPFVTHNDEIRSLFEPRRRRRPAGAEAPATVRNRGACGAGACHEPPDASAPPCR